MKIRMVNSFSEIDEKDFDFKVLKVGTLIELNEMIFKVTKNEALIWSYYDREIVFKKEKGDRYGDLRFNITFLKSDSVLNDYIEIKLLRKKDNKMGIDFIEKINEIMQFLKRKL